MTLEYRRRLLFLFFIAAVVLAAGLGMRDPWPADEPRFALIAKDMVESGNWLLPNVGGVLYPDKPPFFFWTIAALYYLTGSLRIAFLLPGVLAGIGTLFLVVDIARRMWDEDRALWSGAVLLAMLQFPLQMKSGQIDGFLCFWTTLGLYGFLRHLVIGPDWKWYGIGGVASGIGIITKGVGFLPYLVFIPYVIVAMRGWVPSRPNLNWRWLIAPTATLLAIAVWLVPMLMATSGNADPALAEYRNNILYHQTVTRYADSWGHIKPPWYLITNAASWLWAPVTLLLPWLIPAWKRDFQSRNVAVTLLLGWIMLVLLFFSLSDGKRSLYIFPAAPAVALAVGYNARQLANRVGVRRVIVGFGLLLSVMLITIAMYAVMNPNAVDEWVGDGFTTLKIGVALAAIALFMFLIVAITQKKSALLGFSAAMTVFWIGLGTLVLPPLDPVRSGNGIMTKVAQIVGPEDELGLVGWPEQFLLQWGRSVAHFGYRRNDEAGEVADAVRWLSRSEHRKVLINDDWLNDCFDGRNVQFVGHAHRRNWVLASTLSLRPSCTANDLEEPSVVYNYAASRGSLERKLRSGSLARVGRESRAEHSK